MDRTSAGQGQVPEKKQHDAPVEHDWDWEYTGEIYKCLECGHEFRQPPYNFEVCPECGADFWTADM